jgi:hypothetical protein
MLKETIKYTDLDGNPAEEDAYFNLTKAEALELNIRNDLEVIGRSRNNNEIMDMFRRILKASYGKRTTDGKFIKEERDFLVFAASEAYSELFLKLFSSEDYASYFIKAILPADLVAATETAPQPTQSQSDIPTGLATHPSMQGHKAPEQRQETMAELEARMLAKVEARVRAEMEAKERSQTISYETPPAQVSLTPEQTQQPAQGTFPPPDRDQLA